MSDVRFACWVFYFIWAFLHAIIRKNVMHKSPDAHHDIHIRNTSAHCDGKCNFVKLSEFVQIYWNLNTVNIADELMFGLI